MLLVHTRLSILSHFSSTLSLPLLPFIQQRKQLLHLSVPSLFIAVALDEGPGPPLRSPYADLSKLYAVVGILVRSCDVTVMQKSLYEVYIFMHLCACPEMHAPFG